MTLRGLINLGEQYGEDLTLREVMRRHREDQWQAEMASRDRYFAALEAERVRVRADLEDRLADARVALRRGGGA